MRQKLPFSLVALILFLFLGCAQSAKETPAAFTTETVPEGYSFPHPKDVAEPTVHGAWVVQSGTSLCINCHKSESKPNLPGPACDSCHAVYPHAEGWVDQTVHGKYVIDNGQAGCKTQCHGTDLAGGLSKMSCTKCHEIYPHATGWKEPETHGPSAIGDGKLLCQPCHGDDYLGGQSKVACASSNCHNAPYPHVDTWVSGGLHSAYVDENGSTTCKTKCHGTDLAGGLSTVSCTTCHETYPHLAGWEDAQAAQFHGPTAMGTGKNVCKLCHGETFTGGLSQVVCSDCHAHYPHATGWATAGASNHGATVNSEGSTQCQACHGDNNLGSIFSTFCNDCHNQHLSTPTTCTGCHDAEKGLPDGSRRPSDGIHPATQDCAGCHDYATGDFRILKGETIDFTQSGHASTTGAFAKKSASTGCMRCHTATGFIDYIHDDIQGASALASATTPDPLTCTSCHNADTAGYASTGVNIKSTSNKTLFLHMEGLCVRCHSGRTGEGSLRVIAATDGQAEDTVMAGNYAYAQWPGNTSAGGTMTAETNSRNAAISSHLFPVANIFYGSDAGVGYEYTTEVPGKTYVGQNTLMPGYETCIKCHNPHTTEVQASACTPCHSNVSSSADYVNIRVTTADYDGSGTTSESISQEIEGLKAKLLIAMQNYVVNVVGDANGIQFLSGSWKTNPPAPAVAGNYVKWTPRLVKATFNHQLIYRDAAAYIHNSKYVVQLLYDAIENLNAAPGMVPVDMTGMVRP